MRSIGTVALLPLLALGGCAGISYAMENYRGVEIERYAASNGRTYRVFDKPAENRMMVTKTSADAFVGGAVVGATFGGAATAVAGPIVVYETVALEFLASKGRQCEVTRSFLIAEPQYEVQYRCEAA